MARVIDSVVGHKIAIEQLLQLKHKDRWPHAFLFVGLHSIGKSKVALAFAQMLVCANHSEACGTCGPCLRIEKQHSENLILVSPDMSMAKPVIKVEAIRAVLDSLSLSSWSGPRVVLIDQAHRMNPQAANALLKTLEEPFENVYFFLIGPDLQQFLPTIRSRCQVMSFQSLEVADLKKINPNHSEWAYVASRGQLEKLQQLTSAEGVERRTESYQLLQQFLSDKEFLLHDDWRKLVKDKSWTLSTITAWLQILSSSLIAKVSDQKNSQLISAEHAAYFKIVKEAQAEKLFRLAQNLVEAELSIMGNFDPVLIFEKMWVDYARVG